MKRANYISQNTSFHNELYDFTRELLTKVRQDIKDGKDPNSGQLYTLINLLTKLTKVKEYEDTSTKETQAPEKKTRDDLMAQIKDIFGG